MAMEHDDDMKGKGGIVMTTLGIMAKHHIDAIEDEYMAYFNKIRSIHDYLRRPDLPGQRKDGERKNFLMVVTTPLCNDAKEGSVIPAEIGLVVFSLQDGVVETRDYLVNAGEIPFGERGLIINTCAELALPLPGSYETNGVRVSSASKILEEMQHLILKYGLMMGNDVLMFVGRQDICVASSCMNWLISQAPEKAMKFKVFSLEILVMELSRLACPPEEDPAVIQHEGGSAKFIYHTRYDYLTPLACQWHQKEQNLGAVDTCAKLVALKRVYNGLFYLCHLFGKDIEPGTHGPATPTTSVFATTRLLGSSLHDWKRKKELEAPRPVHSYVFTQRAVDNVVYYDGREVMSATTASVSENDDGYDPDSEPAATSEYSGVSSTSAYASSSSTRI